MSTSRSSRVPYLLSRWRAWLTKLARLYVEALACKRRFRSKLWQIMTSLRPESAQQAELPRNCISALKNMESRWVTGPCPSGQGASGAFLGQVNADGDQISANIRNALGAFSQRQMSLLCTKICAKQCRVSQGPEGFSGDTRRSFQVAGATCHPQICFSEGTLVQGSVQPAALFS